MQAVMFFIEKSFFWLFHGLHSIKQNSLCGDSLDLFTNTDLIHSVYPYKTADD